MKILFTPAGPLCSESGPAGLAWHCLAVPVTGWGSLSILVIHLWPFFLSSSISNEDDVLTPISLLVASELGEEGGGQGWWSQRHQTPRRGILLVSSVEECEVNARKGDWSQTVRGCRVWALFCRLRIHSSVLNTECM